MGLSMESKSGYSQYKASDPRWILKLVPQGLQTHNRSLKKTPMWLKLDIIILCKLSLILQFFELHNWNYFNHERHMVISPTCLTAGRPSCVIRKALMHGVFIKKHKTLNAKYIYIL